MLLTLDDFLNSITEKDSLIRGGAASPGSGSSIKKTSPEVSDGGCTCKTEGGHYDIEGDNGFDYESDTMTYDGNGKLDGGEYHRGF